MKRPPHSVVVMMHSCASAHDVWHDSLYVWHDSFIHVTWLIHTRVCHIYVTLCMSYIRESMYVTYIWLYVCHTYMWLCVCHTYVTVCMPYIYESQVLSTQRPTRPLTKHPSTSIYLYTKHNVQNTHLNAKHPFIHEHTGRWPLYVQCYIYDTICCLVYIILHQNI